MTRAVSRRDGGGIAGIAGVAGAPVRTWRGVVAPTAPLTPGRVDGLQRAVGNRATAAVVTLQRDPPVAAPVAPAVDMSRAVPVTLKHGPGSAVVFRTARLATGAIEVEVSGRVSFSGSARLLAESLPRRGAGDVLRRRVRDLLAANLSGATPTALAPDTLALPIGGPQVVLRLAGDPTTSPAFGVTGHFAGGPLSFTLPELELTARRCVLDATVWISPVQSTAGTAADDAMVRSFEFGGATAVFSDALAPRRPGEKRRTVRSGGVVSQDAIADLDHNLPALLRTHAFLRLPEQRAALLQEMRPFFGSDRATIDHFARFRVAAVKGAQTVLHDEAATRLEAVQAEIGQTRMPSSGGVGWPRSEPGLGGRASLANLHNVGFAVDYNATMAPHFAADAAKRDLVQVVTGRSPTASYGAEPDIREVGRIATSGTDQERARIDADPRVTAWLDRVGDETRALGRASENFRQSLRVSGAGGSVTDLAPALQQLRRDWFAAAGSASAQRAVLAQLPTVLAPWLARVDAQAQAMRDRITAAGLDPATLPTGDALTRESDAVAASLRTATASLGRLRDPLARGQRRLVDRLITDARRRLADTDTTAPTDDASAVELLRRLVGRIGVRDGALRQKRWLDRMVDLRTKLTSDGTFVFGASADLEVKDPSAAQLVDRGFYTLQGAPGARAEAFGPEFVRSMLRHGFTHGGSWGTPDLMHFELRWAGGR